jgi:hypothetical protein
MHRDLHRATAQTHIDDLQRSADARRIAADPRPARITSWSRMKPRRYRVGLDRTPVRGRGDAADVTSLAAGGAVN